MNGITNFFPNQLFRTVRIWNILVNQWSRAHLLVNSVPLLLRFQRFSKRIPDTSRLSSQQFFSLVMKENRIRDDELKMMVQMLKCTAKMTNAANKQDKHYLGAKHQNKIVWLRVKIECISWNWSANRKMNESVSTGLRNFHFIHFEQIQWEDTKWQRITNTFKLMLHYIG